MIHNLTPGPDRVWITWDMDFVPATAPAARHIRTVDTDWVDAMGGKAYPVFDAVRGSGVNGRYTFPDQAVDPYGGQFPRNRWVADHDTTLVAVAGHLHPGGLYTDLTLTRGNRTVLLFRSRAHYFEPAGAVSWDVAMTATPASWRVARPQGRHPLGPRHVRHVAGVVVRGDGDHAGGRDAAARRRRGPVPHERRGRPAC